MDEKTLAALFVYGQTAGTYTYKLYGLSENSVLDPQYIPSNVARKSDIPDVSGMVKSVNGNTPDKNGNVKIETGGGASIDVVAEVGQTIRVTEVDASGKPTKWESADYQPRTHWIEYVETTLLDNYVGDASNVGNMLPLYLVEGQSYHVIYNGDHYDCVARPFETEGQVLLLIGNAANFGLEDTGEPFVIIGMPGVGAVVESLVDSEFTITLTTIAEVVYPIPEKYMPASVGAYFPLYVQVVPNVDDPNILIAFISIQELEKALDSGRSIVAKLSSEDEPSVFYLPLARVTSDPNNSNGRIIFFYLASGAQITLTPNEYGNYDVSK
jgi:hypothetical protein